MGTAGVVIAAPQKSIAYDNVFEKQIAFQNKRPPVENSLIRPSGRNLPPPDRMYRHNRARDALKSGRIVSLSIIRGMIRKRFSGKIIDVLLIEPEWEGRPYIYKVKLLQENGRLLMLRLNASNAQIVSVRGR